jgi:hypothetical protein
MIGVFDSPAEAAADDVAVPVPTEAARTLS